MRVDVLTAAKSTALLTRAAVKAFLRIPDATTTHDAILDVLLAGVSAAAVRHIVGTGVASAARCLVAQQYRATLAGANRKLLILPRRPIDSASVVVSIDDTTLVIADDFSIESAAEGLLYRSTLWPACRDYPGMEPDSNVQVDFWAGYVPPTVAATWTNRTVAVGDWVLPSNLAATPLRFRCTVAGAMGATEPTWSEFEAGDDVTAGDATLIAHELPDAPADLLTGAYFAVQTWFRSEAIRGGIAADTMGPHRVEYAGATDFFTEKLPAPTLSLWEGLC